mmetsp:Transcript_44215/g.114893  ORF Transcript_44215/g.114893 Transcript_44215/m.114893 type:complete len:96 (-) Transcript_44215:22-309(-)
MIVLIICMSLVLHYLSCPLYTFSSLCCSGFYSIWNWHAHVSLNDFVVIALFAQLLHTHFSTAHPLKHRTGGFHPRVQFHTNAKLHSHPPSSFTSE